MDNNEQPRNINDEEIKLIKSVFRDSESLLKSTRAVMLGLEPTAEDKAIVKSTFSNDVLMGIFEKRFYPELDRESPIGQIQDVWLGVEKMVFGQPEMVIKQAVEYKELALVMTKQALGLLKDPEGRAVDVTYNAKKLIDPLQVNLLARNQFLRHIEQQLLFVWIIASQKDETPEQAKKRAIKDSAK